MPFIIAFLLYGLFAVLVLAAIAVFGVARGRQPGRAMLVGTIGSLAGLILGCGVAALVCIAGPGAAIGVGATVLIVPAGLVGALLGGVAAIRRM